jgi:hypothetical protein
MHKSGNISAKESGEAEFVIPHKPRFVEAMFVDGLPDDPPTSSCAHQHPDRVFCNIKLIEASDEEGNFDNALLMYAIKITWQISKPRLIWWEVTD